MNPTPSFRNPTNSNPMKRLLILLAAATTLAVQAQTPQEDYLNVVADELIVKLVDDADFNITYGPGGRGTAQDDLAELLGITQPIAETQVMFDEKSVNASSLNQRNFKRSDIGVSDAVKLSGITLKNTMHLYFEEELPYGELMSLVSSLENHPMVEYAEPNYRCEIEDFSIVKTYTAEEAAAFGAGMESDAQRTDGVPNDPLYSQQTSIAQVNLDQVWANHTTGDSTKVIAILDTGVDYDHPDLADNIWINEAEANGVEGFDDDGNGYVDDVRGWDFINADNAPLDDNQHGTHVAGIAAAVGNNGIGITGGVWNARIMPIKVFQSTGVGDLATIAEGITYAATNGADILNMSFGSFVPTVVTAAALENAYATAILVGSAGNSGIKIGPCPPPERCMPHYPSAYNYVLGVEDRPVPLLGYTNWDQDGPVGSGYANLLNYEVATPGTGILSTIPGGGYAELTGTSMSAPLMSAIACMYKTVKPQDSQELMFGSFINTSSTYVDALSAIDTEPSPQLAVLGVEFRDTINGQNGNGFNEPGEIIELLPLVKNYWGPSNDVRVGISWAQFEDTTKATFIKSTAQLGSISAYAALTNPDSTIQLQLAEGLNNNVDIRFVMSIWNGPDSANFASQEFVLNVKNRIILQGLYTEDLTLLGDKEYLIADNMAMAQNTKLTIEAGAEVLVSNGKAIILLGSIEAIGTAENRITIRAEYGLWEGIQLDGGLPRDSCQFKHCDFNFASIAIEGNGIVHDCTFTDCLGGPNGTGGEMLRNNYESNFARPFYNNFAWGGYTGTYIGNNIMNLNDNGAPTEFYSYYGSNQYPGFSGNNVLNNSVGPPPARSISFVNQGDGNLPIPLPNYYGSSNPDILAESIIDFFEDGSLGIVTINAMDSASAEAHGMVWKVLVNGLDAQDQYDELDPVGIGTHEFQVYFNREMDTTITPVIRYGVTIPYVQTTVQEEGSWSADGKVYTVEHVVRIGAADGINRIRVQDAQDLDHFVIPVEDSRFNMLVQSAGSASSGFFATPGLGKIELDWETPSSELIDDMLGYSMYRYQITESTDDEGNVTYEEGDPVAINEALIVGTEFTDFDVEEGESYYYKYKILRTNFEETDFSNAIASTPLTSTLGDSNGDFEVNLLDVIVDVNHILGMNPNPFIFRAADVNNDSVINVLDVVGTVDLILNPTGNMGVNGLDHSITYFPNQPVGEATFTWEGQRLYVESAHAIGGLQLSLPVGLEVELAGGLQNVEHIWYEQDGLNTLMAFSFDNVALTDGKTLLLTVADADAELDLASASVATTGGAPLTPVFRSEELDPTVAPIQGEQADWMTVFPNPVESTLQIDYYLPSRCNRVELLVLDASGKVVEKRNNIRNAPGLSTERLTVTELDQGMYIAIVRALEGRHVVHQQFERFMVK